MPQGTQARLFISYRSEDSSATAARLAHALTQCLGAEAVFLDHARLQGGDDWPDRLRTEVQGADVVLVLVGKRWLSLQDPATGDRLLNLPEDWVRQELEMALQSRRQILPVLVEDARPLTRAALRTVESIVKLADLQAVRLRHEEWDHDVGRIEQWLLARGFVPLPGRSSPEDSPASRPMPRLPSAPAPSRAPMRGKAIAGGAVALLALVMLLVFWQQGETPAPSRPPAGAPERPAADPQAAALTPPVAPAPPPPVLRSVPIEGRVEVRDLFAQDFAALHDSFTIEARDPAGHASLGETPLGADGRFRIPVGVADDRPLQAEMTWKWSSAERFVLWPASQIWTGAPEPSFRFHRLADLYFQERQASLRDVGSGNFDGADQRLQRLEQLLDQFDDPARVVFPTFSIGDLGYRLIQALGSSAADHRAAVGRSRVSDDMIRHEREWRKKQLGAARLTAQPLLDMTAALNAWALFSRQCYSHQQRLWPDRPVLDDPTTLAAAEYTTWLREDLAAVGTHLAWLQRTMPKEHLAQRLNPAQREVLDQAADGQIDSLSMSRLVDLLNTLAAR